MTGTDTSDVLMRVSRDTQTDDLNLEEVFTNIDAFTSTETKESLY